MKKSYKVTSSFWIGNDAYTVGDYIELDDVTANKVMSRLVKAEKPVKAKAKAKK